MTALTSEQLKKYRLVICFFIIIFPAGKPYPGDVQAQKRQRRPRGTGQEEIGPSAEPRRLDRIRRGVHVRSWRLRAGRCRGQDGRRSRCRPVVRVGCVRVRFRRRVK